MSRVAFPFLTLDGRTVQAEPWLLVEDDVEQPIEAEWLAAWDRARSLTLRRLVSIDFAAAATQLDMDVTDGSLALAVRLGTGAGTMPRSILTTLRRDLACDDATFIIEQHVAGQDLSQRLLIETSIVLNEPSPKRGALSPARSGVRLWSDRLDLRLEGEEPRFPMEAVSFAQRFAGRLEAFAPWFLHWTPGNFHRDFGGSVRLFLNSDRDDLTERLLSGDRATLQVVLADVMTQVVSAVLRAPDIDELVAESDPASIAGRALAWMQLAFPGKDWQAIKSMMDLRPSTFHAALLAAADIASLENAP